MYESKNQFLQCTKLLMETLQISNNDLKNIDALNELRVELKQKKQVYQCFLNTFVLILSNLCIYFISNIYYNLCIWIVLKDWKKVSKQVFSKKRNFELIDLYFIKH